MNLRQYFKMVCEMRTDLDRCLVDPSYTPRYLFHGTSEKALEGIFQRGEMVGALEGLTDLYFTIPFKEAQSWADEKGQRHNSKPIVLYLDRNELPKTKFVRNDALGVTLLCQSKIPSKNIRIVDRSLRFLLNR